MSFIFNKGGIVPLLPMNCGRKYDEVSDEELRTLSPELTEEEKNSPFFKYYRKEMPTPSPEILQAIEGGPIYPEEAFMPYDAGRVMLKPGHMEKEMGYCVLDNGIGYAAMTFQQPGRTDEKMTKFNTSFAPIGSLAYKIWFPGAHYMHFVDGCYEDFGWGMQKIRFGNPINLKYLGIDESTILEKDPDTLFFFANSSVGYNPFDPEKKMEYSIMLRHMRKTPTGREWRIRYWFGMAIDEKGNMLTSLKDGEKTPLHNMYLMCKHCGYEYTNEQRLVEEYWADQEL